MALNSAAGFFFKGTAFGRYYHRKSPLTSKPPILPAWDGRIPPFVMFFDWKALDKSVMHIYTYE
jgi:hypothetical protein